MKMAFDFEGTQGTLEIEDTAPNRYGNICGKLTWGGIEEYPTFRSIQQAEAFLADRDALANYIDHAAHA